MRSRVQAPIRGSSDPPVPDFEDQAPLRKESAIIYRNTQLRLR